MGQDKIYKMDYLTSKRCKKLFFLHVIFLKYIKKFNIYIYTRQVQGKDNVHRPHPGKMFLP